MGRPVFAVAGLMRLPRPHTIDDLPAYRDFRLLRCGNFFAFRAQWMQLLSIGWLVKGLSEGSGWDGLRAEQLAVGQRTPSPTPWATD